MLKTVSSITNAIGALNFKGTWNASTNTPTIVSGVGVKGDYFVVSVAGSTTIDGISNWGVGDWITYNGAVWQRVEGGADLNGVNLSVSGTTTLSGLTASTALALNASKEAVSVTNTGTGDNVLGTSPTMTTPRVVTSLNDTNGNEVFGITATGSAVNELTVANAATGNNPTISATGSDTNIGIGLNPKGTGIVQISNTVGTTLRLRATADKNTWAIGEVLTEFQSFGDDQTSSQAGVRSFVRTVNEIDAFGQYWGLSFGTSSFNSAASEKMRITSGGAIHFPGVGTTASAANAFLDNSATPANQLLRSTSSIRYKTDIETLESERADNFILNARPVWYRSLAEADRKEWGWYGLIAEEVAEVDPRLVHWSYPESEYDKFEINVKKERVIVDEHGNETTEPYTETIVDRKLKEDAQLAPDGVQYDRLTVMLLDVVKRQQQEIESLKARLDAANF
jgi:hypothetical protein